MSTFYTVVTVWTDDHTDTRDFTALSQAISEWEFRIRLMSALAEDKVATVRVLRISDKRILDITPSQGDFN